MTDNNGGVGPQDRESEGPTGPVIREKRRLDPETGQVRQPAEPSGSAEQPAEEAEATKLRTFSRHRLCRILILN